MTNEIRADIYEQVLNTDWASLAKYRSGDLLYRVNGDAGMVANNILTFLPNAVSVCISFVGAFSVVMQNDPAMALIALAGRAGFAGHVPLPGEADQGFPEG